MFVCGGVLVRLYTVYPNQPLRWKTPNMRLRCSSQMRLTLCARFAIFLAILLTNTEALEKVQWYSTLISLSKFDCVIVVGEQGCERKASVADSIVRVGLPVVVSKIASVRVTSLFYRNKKMKKRQLRAL